MRKITFQIGESVNVIQDNKVVTGVIRKIFPEVIPPVFMVEIDGEIAKVEIDKIAKIQEAKDQVDDNKDHDRKVQEKAEITITPKEFHDITSEIVGKECAEMGPAGLVVGMAMALVMAKIHKALFIDEAE